MITHLLCCCVARPALLWAELGCALTMQSNMLCCSGILMLQALAAVKGAALSCTVRR